jgi:hypothetical protein
MITLIIRLPQGPSAPRQYPLSSALSFLSPLLTAPPTLGNIIGKRKRIMTDKYREEREEALNPSIRHS